MDKKNKWQEIRNSFIDWCKDIGGLVKENKVIMLIILAFIVFVVGAVVISIAFGKGGNEEAVAIVESSVPEESTVAVEVEPLEMDAYPAINTLIKNYYQAMADGDVATLQTMTTELDEKEQIKIQKKSEYIENYPVVNCYTKKGLTEDSFVVYAYYEVKLVGFEALAPGMNTLYVTGDGAGNYMINTGEQSPEVIAYCEQVSAQDDVVDLINQVQVKYNDLRTNDVELSEFLDELPELLTAAVGEELARLEAEQEALTQTEEETEEEPEEVVIVKTVKTTDVVNVRSSDSETADKLGKAQKGEEFPLIEEKGNGWSKIEFEGKEAFIKSDYLVPVEEEVVTVEDESEEESDEDSNEDSNEDSGNDTDSPTSGTVTIQETVNVRKSASETADRIGICYPGDTVEIVTKQADGWTKVKYNGKTGYIKSEFLK